MDKPAVHHFSLRLPLDLYNAGCEMAQKNEVSFNVFVQNAIMFYLQNGVRQQTVEQRVEDLDRRVRIIEDVIRR